MCGGGQWANLAFDMKLLSIYQPLSGLLTVYIVNLCRRFCPLLWKDGRDFVHSKMSFILIHKRPMEMYLNSFWLSNGEPSEFFSLKSMIVFYFRNYKAKVYQFKCIRQTFVFTKAKIYYF